ncbi:MAG: hypothetical protein KDB69_09960 [Acidimicrobiia bacterium]|nr:hypothetical protein [Acidimicrobiia bacterium]
MPTFDPILLESPYDDPPPNRRWVLITVPVVVAVVIVVGLVVRSQSPGDENADLADAPTATTTIPTPASPPTLVVEPYVSDPQLLIHPTALPGGWVLCAYTERLVDNDRFCDEQTPERWVDVKVVDGEPTSGARTPVGDELNGLWLSTSGSSLSVTYPAGGHSYAVVTSPVLDEDQVLEVATSIPLVSDRASLFGSYEVPVWHEDADALAAILDGHGDVTVDVNGFGSSADLFADDIVLNGFNANGFFLTDFATSFPGAFLVDDERPIVYGESIERNRRYAAWDQAGWAWRLESALSMDATMELVEQLIERLYGLGTPVR